MQWDKEGDMRKYPHIMIALMMVMFMMVSNVGIATAANVDLPFSIDSLNALGSLWDVDFILTDDQGSLGDPQISYQDYDAWNFMLAINDYLNNEADVDWIGGVNHYQIPLSDMTWPDGPSAVATTYHFAGSWIMTGVTGYPSLASFQTVGFLTADIRPHTAAVPIPGAVWLLGSGLIGLVGIRKKMKK